LVFAARIARWPEVNEFINWGVIVMYGGDIGAL
jgi:di/tricarboxylate transporter